jgi:hypothetical protein
MRELEVREGEGRQSIRKGKEYSQVMAGTVSVTTHRYLLEKRAEMLWECPVCYEADS